MNSLACPDCRKHIKNVITGDIVGCDHFPADDFTEISGKHLSDGMNREDADRKAFGQMVMQMELFNVAAD